MRRILLPLVVLLVVASGCRVDGTSDPGTGTDGSRTTSASTEQRRELAEARARWAERRIDDYTLTYERTCFCAALAYRVRVANGNDVEARVLPGGRGALPSGSTAGEEVPYRSVEDVFDAVESALDDLDAGTVDDVSAEFDPGWGYPQRYGIDPDDDTFDDEGGIVVTAFAPTIK